MPVGQPMVVKFVYYEFWGRAEIANSGLSKSLPGGLRIPEITASIDKETRNKNDAKVPHRMRDQLAGIP